MFFNSTVYLDAPGIGCDIRMRILALIVSREGQGLVQVSDDVRGVVAVRFSIAMIGFSAP